MKNANDNELFYWTMAELDSWHGLFEPALLSTLGNYIASICDARFEVNRYVVRA